MNIFEALKQINQSDIDKGTKNLQLGTSVVSADYNKPNGFIKMGVPGEIVLDMHAGKDLRIFILIVDGKELDALTK